MVTPRQAALVGAYEFPLRRAPQFSEPMIHAECARRALDDAGLRKADVDAYFTSGLPGMPAIAMAEYLGIRPRYLDSTSIGGSSFVAHAGHAALALAAGHCEVALITYGSSAWSARRAIGTGGRGATAGGADAYDAPFGTTIIGAYALAAQRHMFEFGTTGPQLAEVSVATRKWAAKNPNAMFRDPLTVEDVLRSRMISSPLHLLDCCVISDGGGAVVMTTAERARDLPKPPVWVLGAAEAGSHTTLSQMDSLVTGPAAVSGPLAFAQAGVRPEDVDLAMVYDSFTITVVITLEDLGFCAKGEGGAFVGGQRTAPGGPLPMNTDGGGLSSNHPGMRGIFLLIEAVKQLRGEAGERQIPAPKLAVCNGTGGLLSSAATVVLAVD
jgi:acetyl-CoA acetyltransferase